MGGHVLWLDSEYIKVIDDFVKKSQYTYYTKDALLKVADKVAFFAEKEGLSAHAKSATVRFEDKK